MVSQILIIYLSTLSVYSLLAYKSFLEKVPNGNLVPNPCNTSEKWPGFGHMTQKGGGNLSQFGESFLKEGKKWTHQLCKMDSDGDGVSNGEELGDPNCEWKKGGSNTPGYVITNPSICDRSGCTNSCSEPTGIGSEYLNNAVKPNNTKSVTVANTNNSSASQLTLVQLHSSVTILLALLLCRLLVT